MAEKVIAPVQPAVLVWGRRTACVTIEDAARAVGVTPERIEAFERGDEQPTLPMLRALAGKYRRPLAVMLLPEPSHTFQALRDFRRVDELSGRVMPARVAYEIRQAQERRELALDLLRDSDAAAATFPLRAAVTDDVDDVAAEIRRFLGADFAQQSRAAGGGQAFVYWRHLLEAKDVLVFVMGGNTGPKVREVRGFAVPYPILPIVAVNGRDKTAGRAFTLLHELTHVILGTAVVENAVQPGPWLPAADRKIERFCNAVAAAVLMPLEEARRIGREAGKTGDASWTDAELDRAAVTFGASREAVLLRMVGMGYAARRFYSHRRKGFELEYERLDDPVVGSRGPAPHLTMIGKYGKPYARIVLASYHERRITMKDAAAYLSVQAKHIEAVQRQAYRRA